MKKSKKSLKLFLLIAIVAIAGSAAWFLLGSSSSKASNYSGCYKTIKFDNTKLNWSECYAYCWDSKGNVDVIEFEPTDANTFYGVLGGYKYSKMLFKNTPGKDNWDKQTVDLTPPSGPCLFVFEPSNTDGKIDGEFICDDYEYITVYYKNDNIATPYFYYQIGNGKWSDNFGTKMTESTKKPGYYEATVLLSGEDTIKCCFNNGDNSVAWDNNNYQDYTLTSTKCYNYYMIDNGTLTITK